MARRLATPQSIKPKGKRKNGLHVLYAGGGYRVKFRQEGEDHWIVKVVIDGMGETEWPSLLLPSLEAARETIDVAKRGIATRIQDHKLILQRIYINDKLEFDQIFVKRPGWGQNYRRRRINELREMEAIRKKGKRYSLTEYGEEYMTSIL